jgi:hypothetical protein
MPPDAWRHRVDDLWASFDEHGEDEFRGARARRGQGTEGKKPLWSRRSGVVPRRGRLSGAAARPTRAAGAATRPLGRRGPLARRGQAPCVFHNTFAPVAAGALANLLGLAPVSDA